MQKNTKQIYHVNNEEESGFLKKAEARVDSGSAIMGERWDSIW
jgi:hypothetical protein